MTHAQMIRLLNKLTTHQQEIGEYTAAVDHLALPCLRKQNHELCNVTNIITARELICIKNK